MPTTEIMDIFPDKCGKRSDTESKKLCAVCNTAKTPLWRSGPHGPKSLCNACGIKFRKKKGSSALELNKEPSNTKKDQSSSSSTGTGCGGKKGNDGKNNVVSSSRGKDGKLGSKLKERLMGLGKEVVLLKRPRSPMKRQWSGKKKKAGEVEQAAALLMALSCASVYA